MRHIHLNPHRRLSKLPLALRSLVLHGPVLPSLWLLLLFRELISPNQSLGLSVPTSFFCPHFFDPSHGVNALLSFLSVSSASGCLLGGPP